jgi:gluconokinase
MLLILFGLSGSGKNFVGDIFQKQFGFYHWDADLMLTADMLTCIKEKKHFTQQMRDNFTTLIIDKISELCPAYPDLVISQALYKEKNRRELLEAFPLAQLIHILADADQIIERLTERRGITDAAYAATIQNNFEKPDLPYEIIINNTGEEDVIRQAQQMILYLAARQHPRR